MKKIDILLASSEKILSFPPVVARLNQLFAEPKSSLIEVDAVLRRDPALTARILRLANSPA